MDASPSPQASEPDDSPPGTRTYITERHPDDPEPVVARFRCESPTGWTATGTLSQTSRGLGISEMNVDPWRIDGEPGHITSSLLRQIPTGAILAAAQSVGISVVDTNALIPPEEKRQPGRQPLPDLLLAEVAVRYLTETAPGKPRGAILRVAHQMAKPAPTVSRWVMRARADGWLGPAVPGREGADPGPRLDAFIETRDGGMIAIQVKHHGASPNATYGETPPGAAPTMQVFDDPTAE